MSLEINTAFKENRKIVLTETVFLKDFMKNKI
jgi:hypothetical protein